MFPTLIIALFYTLWLHHGKALADDLPNLECKTESCVISEGAVYLEQHQPNKTLKFLKQYRTTYPDSGILTRMMASAYLQKNNHFWAIKTLTDWLTKHPEDCETRILQGWVYLLQAGMEGARAALDPADSTGSCETAEGALLTRLLMVKAFLEFNEESKEATETILQALEQEKVYPSDSKTLRLISDMILSQELSELNWRTDITGGYTTNALMGAPNDAGLTQVKPESPFFAADLWLQYAPFLGSFIRPSLEFQFKGTRYNSGDVSELSSLTLSGRAGIVLTALPSRLFIGYRPEFLLLGKGDQYTPGPIWYLGAHRGEIEYELSSWLLVFIGAGRRDFNEIARTRTEFDGGVGGALSFGKLPLSAIWALNFKDHIADKADLDMIGVGALVSLSLRLPKKIRVKLTGSFYADWYPESAEYYENIKREETLFRVGLATWSPPLWGISAGLHYEFSTKNSTIDQYTFEDHRVFLKLRWTGRTNFGHPIIADEDTQPAIEWGLSEDENSSGERLQDLLRQDEPINQSCGCSL